MGNGALVMFYSCSAIAPMATATQQHWWISCQYLAVASYHGSDSPLSLASRSMCGMLAKNSANAIAMTVAGGILPDDLTPLYNEKDKDSAVAARKMPL
jgi:hypothetical protein